jgi:hypothetical protein
MNGCLYGGSEKELMRNSYSLLPKTALRIIIKTINVIQNIEHRGKAMTISKSASIHEQSKMYTPGGVFHELRTEKLYGFEA